VERPDAVDRDRRYLESIRGNLESGRRDRDCDHWDLDSDRPYPGVADRPRGEADAGAWRWRGNGGGWDLLSALKSRECKSYGIMLTQSHSQPPVEHFPNTTWHE